MKLLRAASRNPSSHSDKSGRDLVRARPLSSTFSTSITGRRRIWLSGISTQDRREYHHYQFNHAEPVCKPVAEA